MTKFRRFVVLSLVATLLIGMLPHSVWAQESLPPQTKEVRTPIIAGGQVLKPITQDAAIAMLEKAIVKAYNSDDIVNQLRLADLHKRISTGEITQEIIRETLEQQQNPDTAESTKNAACLAALPWGFPGWVVGAACAVVSIIVGVGVGVILTLVIDDGAGPQTLYYETVIGEQQIEAEVTLWTPLGDVSTDLFQFPFSSPEWLPLVYLVAGTATVDLAIATREEIQNLYKDHLLSHPNAQANFEMVYAATGGGYHEPEHEPDPNDPDEWSRFLCYIANRTWLVKGLVNGLKNTIPHVRTMMMMRDMDVGNWWVIVVGTPAEARLGRWVYYTSKAFVITAYKTNYDLPSYLRGIVAKYVNLGFRQCSKSMHEVDPLPRWPYPPTGAFRMYIPMAPSGGWVTRAAAP